MLLEQLHRHPARGLPLPEEPQGLRMLAEAADACSSSSGQEDMLLQLMTDEVMPLFLADASVHQLLLTLQQQQTPADLNDVGGGASTLPSCPVLRGLSSETQ